MDLRTFAAQLAQITQQTQEAQRAEPAPYALQAEQEAQRAAQRKSLEICQEYQAARARSAELQASILKGLNVGENPYTLLVKCADCIGLLIGETRVFPQTVKARIVDVYGRGLEDPQALGVELEDTRHRLAMLQRPDLEKTTHVNAAIRAHQGRIKEIIAIQDRTA